MPWTPISSWSTWGVRQSYGLGSSETEFMYSWDHSKALQIWTTKRLASKSLSGSEQKHKCRHETFLQNILNFFPMLQPQNSGIFHSVSIGQYLYIQPTFIIIQWLFLGAIIGVWYKQKVLLFRFAAPFHSLHAFIKNSRIPWNCENHLGEANSLVIEAFLCSFQLKLIQQNIKDLVLFETKYRNRLLRERIISHLGLCISVH